MQNKRNMVLYLFTPLLLQWAVSFAVEFLAIYFLEDAGRYASEITVFISLLILPAAGYIYRLDLKREPWESGKHFDKKEMIRVIFLGIVSCMLLNVFISLVNVQEISSQYQAVESQIYQSSYFVQAVGMGIIAPAMEELIYRGLLYRRIRMVSSVKTAILFSAFIFGILHGNLVQFLFAAAMGVLLAFIYEKYRCIYAPVLMHIVVNLTSLSLTWITSMH